MRPTREDRILILSRHKQLRFWRQREARIIRPIGYRLLSAADFLFSRKTNSKVLVPIIRDLQDEHTEALAEGRLWKAHYVQTRGYYAFWIAIGALWSGSLIRRFLMAIGFGLVSG